MSEQCPPTSPFVTIQTGTLLIFSQFCFIPVLVEMNNHKLLSMLPAHRAPTLLQNLVNAIKCMICQISWLYVSIWHYSVIRESRLSQIEWGMPDQCLFKLSKLGSVINYKPKACFCAAFFCLKRLQKHILVYCSFNWKCPPCCFCTVKLEAVKTEM